MSRALRSLSAGLLSCPVCNHHDFNLGKLAQHIRKQHADHSCDSAQLQQFQDLGLSSCPKCRLYYSNNNNAFNKHIQQCEWTTIVSRKRKSNSTKSNSNSNSNKPAKRSREQQEATFLFPNHPQRHLDEEELLEMKNAEGEKNNEAELLLNIHQQRSLPEVEEVKNNVAETENTINTPATASAAIHLNLHTDATDHIDSITPADIANHPKLLRKIPYINRATFNSTMRRPLSEYTQASLQKDPAAQHRLIVEILSIPGQTMISRRGGKKGKHRDIILMHHRLIQKNLAALSATSSAASAATAASRPITRSISQAPLLSSIARSVALTREGHYRRAIRAISSTTPLVDTSQPEKLVLLQKLHPLPLPHDSVLPVLPDDIPMLTVNADEGLVKIICQMVNGSAPGPSGWTAEMVRVLTEDPDCLTGLAMLIQDITNGNLPDSIKPFLLASNLIGLDKNDGVSVRPIAIGEIFYRIAAYRGQLYVQGAAKDILQPIQLGVAVSGGCEAVVHNLQHALQLCDQPVAALAIDFKNAFNSISRKAMLETLYSHPQLQYIWRLVHFAYSAPSDLLVRNSDGSLFPGVFSAQGVRQGDPLSSLLFALTIQPVYEAVIRQHPTINATAIHDDITLVGQPDDIVSAYSTITNLALALGLEVQPAKCQLIYFHSDTVPLSNAVHSFLTQHYIPLQKQSAIILGAPIGATIEDIETLALLTLKDQMQVLQHLLHEAMPIQEAILLLRISSTHKLDYLLRCVPPSAMKNLAAEFDRQLLDAFIKKTDIQSQLNRPGVDAAPILNQIAMPVADAGGFGVTRAQDVMHIAYVSSLASTIQSARSIQSFAPYNNSDHILPDDSTLHQELTTALSIVHQQISVDPINDEKTDAVDNIIDQLDEDSRLNSASKMLPLTANEFITSFNQPLSSAAFSTYNLQARLTMKAQAKIKKASLSAARDAAKTQKTIAALTTHSRMLAVTAPGASTWISATAFDAATTIPNDAYKLAVRLRLGLAPQDIMPNNCHSCHVYSRQNLSLVEKNEWHYLSCIQGHGGREITIRHNQVVAAIDRFAKLAGAVVVVEPKHLFSDSSKRPDLQIIMNHKNYLLDITIVSPTAPSHLSHSQKLLGQAEAAEKSKINKYEEISEDQHAIFVPFVIETYGGIGKRAQEFLNELSIFAIDHTTIRSRFDVVSGLRYAIACSVQRGNALIASAGYANALRVYRDRA